MISLFHQLGDVSLTERIEAWGANFPMSDEMIQTWDYKFTMNEPSLPIVIERRKLRNADSIERRNVLRAKEVAAQAQLLARVPVYMVHRYCVCVGVCVRIGFLVVIVGA